MVIYSSSLCKDVAFELIPAPEANKIDCRRVVTDEMYERSKSPGPEAIEGGTGSGVFEDSTEQIKFKQRDEHGPKSPLDKASQKGPNLPSAFKGMAALIQQTEATKHKQLDQIIAELSDEQRDLFQRMLDFVDGKTDRVQPVEHDQNVQLVEIDAILEALFGKVGDTKETRKGSQAMLRDSDPHGDRKGGSQDAQEAEEEHVPRDKAEMNT